MSTREKKENTDKQTNEVRKLSKSQKLLPTKIGIFKKNKIMR